MPLSLKEAQTAVELARVHAEQIGVPMNIAVVDGGGHLLAFARMDKSIPGSIDIALKKAKTSVLFNDWLSTGTSFKTRPPRRNRRADCR